MNTILTDDNILEIKQQISNQKRWLKRIEFSYKTAQKTLNVEAFGIGEIHNDGDYYDNIEDNLVFSNFSWLSPLAKDLDKNLQLSFDAEIKVLPNGDMEHSGINLVITAGVKNGDRAPALRYARKLFPILVPFRQYIKDVSFNGNDHKLKTIHFNLELDGTKVNSILSNSQNTNQQVLNQWLSSLDHVLSYNQNKYKYISTVAIVNGKMNVASFESADCFRFGDGKQ